jgi:hypothetical protein
MKYLIKSDEEKSSNRLLAICAVKAVGLICLFSYLWYVV